MMSDTTIDFQRLLQLVRCSLLGTEVDASLFSSMEADDWLHLMGYSKTQGVSAVAFQAFNNTETCTVRPPMRQLGMWYGQAGYVTEQFTKRQTVARKLAHFYKKRDINMLIMKGLSLAHLYPVPSTREFGDLDIYTFDKHEEANRTIAERGAKITLDEKHDEFHVGGVMVEHHRTFLQNDSKAAEMLNSFLPTTVSPEVCERDEDSWLLPTSDFNATYLLRHMTTHLTYEGLPLKNVLDYALFLINEGDKVHWDVVRKVINDSGMTIAFDTFVAVSEKVLDVDLSRYHIAAVDSILVDKVMKEISDVALHQEGDLPFLKRIYRKLHRIFSYRWVYTSGLLPDRFWGEYIHRSVRDHLLNPERI